MMTDWQKSIISIIVPIYKVEMYLPKCIDSILSQTYTNLEIILVDDGSPDNCGCICDEYAKLDSRIKVIHKENGGLSDARNAGIEVATGEYLAFVDSDDYIASDMYEKLLQALVFNGADMAICNFKYVGDGVYDNENLPIKDECLTGIQIISEKMLGEKPWYWVVAWNKLYKKELFENVRYPVGKIHEDEFVIHKLLVQCEKVACVEEMLYSYLQRENSIMGVKNAVKRLDGVEAIFQRSEYYFEIGMPRAVILGTVNNGICTLYSLFSDDVMKNQEFVVKYKAICKQYKKCAPRLFWNVSWKDKIRMCANVVSPYMWWKMRGGR